MKLSFFIFALLLLPSLALAEHTRVTNPSAVYVEVLGRTLRYGVYFDRVVSDDLSVGVGYGSSGMNTADGSSSGVTAQMIPVYANYFFAREANSVFVTGGATWVINANETNGLNSQLGNIRFNNSGVLPQLGLGFESRADAGFLFRVAGYGIVATQIGAWFGFSFGYSF